MQAAAESGFHKSINNDDHSRDSLLLSVRHLPEKNMGAEEVSRKFLALFAYRWSL